MRQLETAMSVARPYDSKGLDLTAGVLETALSDGVPLLEPRKRSG